jgi:hypothetical protein
MVALAVGASCLFATGARPALAAGAAQETIAPVTK